MITVAFSCRWLGTGPNITVVDTPGFKDTEDAEFIDELMNVLGDEVLILRCAVSSLQKPQCFYNNTEIH